MVRLGFRDRVLFVGLVLAAALLPEAPSARGDDAFRTQSTLDAAVAPQDLALDATIASMVRRGLLADVNANAAPAASRPAVTQKPAPAPQRPAASAQRPATPPTRPAVAPVQIPPMPGQSNAASTRTGWRAAGSRPQATTPAPTPRIAVAPRPHANYSTPNQLRATPPSTTPAPPAPSTTKPQAAAPSLPHLHQPQTIAVISPARPIESAPTLVPAAPTTEPTLPTAQPKLPADDHLAPIDSLPETPAPAHDAPGDPREPEQELEAGAPVPNANADPNASQSSGAKVTLPDRTSVAGSQMIPIGEPDRVARKSDETAPPPEDAENYQETEEEEKTVEPTPTTPTPKLPPLSRNQTLLRDKVRRVLKHYYNHPLNTGNRSPWEVMHQMLAFEVYSRIRQGGPEGQPVTAVGWLCFNRSCKGRTLMYLNEEGDIRVKVGPALQGHHGQLLALLAQARVRSDYPMQIDGKDFTVADLIDMEKQTCYPRTELTFKLLGLQRYLDMDARWMNDQGMAWDFPTMLREEMRQPVRTAACGGTHRLSGLILTTKKYQRTGKPLSGAYAEAARFVANYQNYAYRLQNPDGSFSTEWFKGPGAEEDIDRRLKTTGHQLEFLIYAANHEQLAYYCTVKAVNYLANIMWANRDRDWEAGPLGHAIHALVLYDRLVFVPHDEPAPGGPVAAKPSHVRK